MAAKVFLPAILILVSAICLPLVSAQSCTSVKGNIVPDRYGTPGPAALTGLGIQCGAKQALRAFNMIRTDAAGNPAVGKDHMRLVGTCCSDPGMLSGWADYITPGVKYYYPLALQTTPYSTNVIEYTEGMTFGDYDEEFDMHQISSVDGADVRCRDGEVLHSFEYVDGGQPGTLKVDFECLRYNGTSLGVTDKTTTPTATGELKKGNVLIDMAYWAVFLDRQTVACGNDAWLTGFTGPMFRVDTPEGSGQTIWRVIDDGYIYDAPKKDLAVQVPPPTSWSYKYSCLTKPAGQAASIGLGDNASAAVGPATAPVVAPAPATSGALQRVAVATIGAAAVALAALVVAI